MNKFKVGIIQMSVSIDKKVNIQNANNYIKRISEKKADIIVLPEMFCCPYDSSKFPLYAEFENESTFSELSKIARKYKIYLVCGSVPEKDRSGKIYNTSYVFDRNGELIAKHRKIHLFDISIEHGQQFKESDTLSAGNNITTFDTEFGKIGLCICYDFRFPELSRLMALKGAKVIIVPASFNMTTGPVHWELLFKARAVDNQVYTIGCACAQDNTSSYISYANSLVVSPWGEIIDKMNFEHGFFICDINLDYVDKVRKELPLLSNRRKDIY